MADNRLRNALDPKKRGAGRDEREENGEQDPDRWRAGDGADDMEQRARNANLYTGKVRQPGLIRQTGDRPLILLVFVAAIAVILIAYAALA